MFFDVLRPRVIRSLLLVTAAAAWASAVQAAEPAPTPGVLRTERGALVLENVPATPPDLAERLLQYQNTRGAAVRGWLPDGAGVVIGTRFGETAQVHVVRRPLGARTQITFFKEPVGGLTMHPTKLEAILAKDSGGDEFFQLYHFDIAQARFTKLTEGRFQHRGVQFSNGGDRFVFTSNRRNGTDYDIYLGRSEAPKDWKLLLERAGTWAVIDFSPDDKRLLLGNYVSANESSLHELDIATGTVTRLTPEGVSAWSAAGYTADGKSVFVISDVASEFQQLGVLSCSGDPTVRWISDSIPWDVSEAALSPDRQHLAFTTNEDGADRLHLLDVATGKHSPAAAVPTGLIATLSFSPDSSRLAFALNTARSPSDVHVLTLATRAVERWTESEIGGLNSATFTEPQLVRWPTFDQVDGKPRQISGFLYKPAKPGPHPVLIDIHGGPEAQFQPGFSSFIQFLVNELGIAFLSPNVRGSSGYGKSFLKLDNGFLREDSVKDIGALLDWIATQPDLDTKRVGVHGGSYGGYMSYAVMTHYNDRMRCGISVVGISNFVTFLTNTEAYRRDRRRVEYGDEREPKMREFLERISPLNNVSKITKPMMIMQGANDPRVPVTEAEQMRTAIRANGGDVWYFLAKDEGHGFQKKVNRDAYLEAVVLFLQEHLVK